MSDLLHTLLFVCIFFTGLALLAGVFYGSDEP